MATKQKVIITGGSRGIGAAAVRSFASHNANVAFFYRRSYESALRLSRETGALNLKCNVADPESVAEMMPVALDYLGGTADALICNAGIADYGLITDIGAERWNEVVDTNLNGAYYCINEVLPGMISARRGSIIIVSSMWGQVGSSCEVAYSAAKAGLIGLTKALAKEVGPSGVRVNCIAPGLIDTDMNDEVNALSIEELVDETPLSRIGSKQDVVNMMEYLVSDKSSFITGQVIGINGGLVV